MSSSLSTTEEKKQQQHDREDAADAELVERLKSWCYL